MKSLGILLTHPIQYYACWFRYLAKRMDIEVFYLHRQDNKGQAAAGFGVEFDWDIPLLEGYAYRWLKNIARKPTLSHFSGVDTPEIYDLIRRKHYEALMICGWNKKSSLQAIHACWKNRVPVLMRSDSQLIKKCSPLKLMAKYIPYRWFLPRLAAHLYVGKRNQEYLRHYGVPEEKLFFAPHFVDNNFFSQGSNGLKKNLSPRREFGIPPGAFVFLFVGKFIPKKRPADFINACIRLFRLSEGSHIHAILVGDGPLRGKLEEIARSYRDRIHFAGFRNQSELPLFYRASDALVLASDEKETWGLVVNEAFASGLPAIVSDGCGCVSDMIEEAKTGYSYPTGDIDRLTSCMLNLKRLCNNSPAEVRQALSDKITVYSLEKATEGLERALQWMQNL